MKISNSKKELARIISENGGWRDGVGYSAMDTNGMVYGYLYHPKWNTSMREWNGSSMFRMFISKTPTPNHQRTALSRAEYLHLYPAPDADAWIEWRGGECPVERGTLISVKYRDGEIRNKMSAMDPVSCSYGVTEPYWRCDMTNGDIIAYRLHNPEQAKAEFCESVERSIPEPEYKPSIEQLMQTHCDRAHALSEKKAELLVAERQELEALEALKDACKEAGFGISPIEKLREKKEPELVITDWRDLRVGDIIECVSVCIEGGDEMFESDKIHHGKRCKVIGFTDNGINHIKTDLTRLGHYIEDFKFIRRP